VFTQIFAETETSTQMEQGKIAKTDFDAAVKFALGKWVTHQQDPSVPLTRNRRDSALDYKAVYECTNPTAPWSPRKGFPAGQDAIKGTACVLEVTAANGEKQNAIAVALDYPSELSGATDFGNVGTPVYFFSTQKGLLAGAGFQLTGDIGGYFGMRKLGFSNLSVSVDAPDGASRDDDGVRLPCTPVKK
jgi:hypothetical protein